MSDVQWPPNESFAAVRVREVRGGGDVGLCIERKLSLVRVLGRAYFSRFALFVCLLYDVEGFLW